MIPDALNILAGAEELDEFMLAWACRDDSKAQPEVRQAASKAVDVIDTLLRDLHTIRVRLVGEIRKSDDAALVRTEALLAQRSAGDVEDVALACGYPMDGSTLPTG
jgi:hypothetical protein